MSGIHRKTKPPKDEQHQRPTPDKINKVMDYENRGGRSRPVEDSRATRNSIHMDIDSTGARTSSPSRPSQSANGPSGPIPSPPTTLHETLRLQPTVARDTRTVTVKRHPYEAEKPRVEAGKGSGGGWFSPLAGVHSYITGCPALTEELYARDSRIRDLEQAISRLKSEYFSYEKEYSAKIEHLERLVSDQAQKVQGAQDAAFRLMNQTRPEADDDTYIRGRFESMTTGWRKWAKDHCAHDLSGLDKALAEETRDGILKEIAGYVRLGPSGKLPQKLFDMKTGPSIFLHAMLANFVYQNIFLAPFFFLENHDHEADSNKGGENQQGQDGMEQQEKEKEKRRQDQRPLSSPSLIYDKLLEVNEKEAHIWRSNTLRLLTPRDESHLPLPALSALAEVKSLQSNAYEQLTKRFLAGPAGTILKPLGEPDLSLREQELLAVISEAGALSCRLWTQRTKIECFSLDVFHDKPFENGSKWMNAHVSHRLEEDDRRLDGWRIEVVVQPAVVARGNEDAEGYGLPGRSWTEALVWMVDDGGESAARAIKRERELMLSEY